MKVVRQGRSFQSKAPRSFAAKLAVHVRKKGRRPLLVAADIYRPAAVEQLSVLARQIGVPVYAPGTNLPVAEIVEDVHRAVEIGISMVHLHARDDVEAPDWRPEAYQAILDAAASRARPVFLGAVTTVLGVAPLLVDPFFRSMAITIMFGLIFATGLTLVVVPLLYAAFFGIRVNESGSVR